ALHDRLLPEAARARLHGWREALTVGFDLGRDLPFGILAPQGCAPYGQRLALVSLPSLALGFDYAGRGDVPGGSAKEVVLVVGGDPPPGSPLESFRFDRAERERWLAPFEPSTVEVLEGARATPAALRAVQALLGGARLVHFVAHGTLLPGRESSAALVLPAGRPDEERLLGAEQVARLCVGGLVVLSACSPGRGPARLGDDCLVNLGGAFLAAGARCVVLSRFPVEYHSTLALMEHFHRGLAQGASPAEALRAARARLASEDALAAAHAAAFEVIGLGFDPVFAR
ncbi:MAG: CHAT domain-containing protein, partial [Planctomycetes bacterium]|nr:CHAT domain-containing protein [Planctomycetota bacterium]